MVAVTPHHGLLVTTLLVLGASGGVAQEPVLGVDAILARVGARLERHYERARRIVSTEEVWVRSFTREMRAYGSPRWLEFEHRVEWAAEEAGGVDRFSDYLITGIVSIVLVALFVPMVPWLQRTIRRWNPGRDLGGEA